MIGFKKKTWTAETHDGGDNVYVWPNNDLIEHEGMSDECVCGPNVEPFYREDGSNAWMYVHASLDGREHEAAKPRKRAFIQARYVAALFAGIAAVQAVVEVKRRQ